MELEEELGKLMNVLEDVKLLGELGKDVLELARAYASDALYFLRKGENENALEAYAIAWAYLDALLHLGLVSVNDTSLFTVGD